MIDHLGQHLREPSVFSIESELLSDVKATARMVRGGTTDPLVVPGPPIAVGRYVRNPWRSPCVPVQLTGYDADSPCPMRHEIQTLPSNGFLGELVLPVAASVSASASDTCDDLDNLMIEGPHHRFSHRLCCIPFSSTFTGTDTFTYTVNDNDDQDSAPATVEIEIFEGTR